MSGVAPELAARCRAFLEREPPAGLGYVKGSIAERVLRLAAAGTAPDEELLELAELCVPDSRATAETLGGAAGDYLLESAALLEEVAAAAE